MEKAGEQVTRETRVKLAWHDLRRTFATEMGEHAAAPFAVVDGLLNHAATGTRSGAAKAYHHAVERPQARGDDGVGSHRGPCRRTAPGRGRRRATSCSWRRRAANMISDNPRHETLVERFRELLAAFEDWYCRQGEPGTFEEAGRIVVKLATLIKDSGLGEVEFHRFCAAGRDHDEDDPPDEALPTDTGLLRAIRGSTTTSRRQ